MGRMRVLKDTAKVRLEADWRKGGLPIYKYNNNLPRKIPLIIF